MKVDDKPRVFKYFPTGRTKNNERERHPFLHPGKPYALSDLFLFHRRNSSDTPLETLSKISKFFAKFMAVESRSALYIYRCHGDTRCLGKFVENAQGKLSEYRRKIHGWSTALYGLCCIFTTNRDSIRILMATGIRRYLYRNKYFVLLNSISVTGVRF